MISTIKVYIRDWYTIRFATFRPLRLFHTHTIDLLSAINNISNSLWLTAQCFWKLVFAPSAFWGIMSLEIASFRHSETSYRIALIEADANMFMQQTKCRLLFLNNIKDVDKGVIRISFDLLESSGWSEPCQNYVARPNNLRTFQWHCAVQYIAVAVGSVVTISDSVLMDLLIKVAGKGPVSSNVHYYCSAFRLSSRDDGDLLFISNSETNKREERQRSGMSFSDLSR